MTDVKTDVITINPASMTMDMLKQAAIDILAGEYADEKGITDDMVAAIKGEYANKSRQSEYHNALASGDPMKYLCEKYGYGTLSIKKGTNGSHVVDSSKNFDLTHAADEIPGGIGAKPTWNRNAERLCNELVYRAKMALGDDAVEDLMKDNPYNKDLKEIDAAIKNGENPVSQTAVHKSLERLVQSMLGEEYHISVKDTRLLLLTFVSNKKSSNNEVTVGDVKNVLTIILKICHRIMTNKKGYFVSSKLTRKK